MYSWEAHILVKKFLVLAAICKTRVVNGFCSDLLSLHRKLNNFFVSRQVQFSVFCDVVLLQNSQLCSTKRGLLFKASCVV